METVRTDQTIMKKEKWRIDDTKANILALSFFSVLLIIVISFHEPWFDEAQSWLIARDASFHDMLLVIPHYEGHPPLWWFILSIPAKLGLPYEISLKTINVLFSVTAAYLIIFKSPFPKWIKYTLPFTYFLFYQYGVISRPYSIMACAFFLCAMGWEKRNEEPFHFVLPLMLLCLSSAYGILIAGGFSLAWTIEIIGERTLFNNITRLLSLLLLLSLALCLLLILLPKDNTYAGSLYFTEKPNTAIQRFLLFFFCLPAEMSFSSYGNDDLLNLFHPSVFAVCYMTVVSTIIWVCFFFLTSKKTTFPYLIISYTALAIFASLKYFHMHHLGVLFLLFIFTAWISLVKRSQFSECKWLSIAASAFLVLGLSISAFWTAFSSIDDIQSNYSPGKELAGLIKKYQLDEYRWTSLWARDFDDEDNMVYEDTHKLHGVVVEVNPYLQKPITGIQGGGTSYNDHILISTKEMNSETEAIKNRGTDIFIGVPISGNYLKDLGYNDNLKVVWILHSDKVWKASHAYGDTFISIRADLAEKLDVGE